MGVYIKGMEMPDGCVVCPFFIVNRHDRGDDSLCRASRKEVKCGCPLIPVPPHGDLIDRREAIIDANERAYDFWLSDDEVNATIQFLNEQTTIIPIEEGET